MQQRSARSTPAGSTDKKPKMKAMLLRNWKYSVWPAPNSLKSSMLEWRTSCVACCVCRSRYRCLLAAATVVVSQHSRGPCGAGARAARGRAGRAPGSGMWTAWSHKHMPRRTWLPPRPASSTCHGPPGLSLIARSARAAVGAAAQPASPCGGTPAPASRVLSWGRPPTRQPPQPHLQKHGGGPAALLHTARSPPLARLHLQSCQHHRCCCCASMLASSWRCALNCFEAKSKHKATENHSCRAPPAHTANPCAPPPRCCCCWRPG